MKDVLLLICVASVFTGGYFLMKRLDCFLNSHVHPESERTHTCPCLKIGVADPLMMGSLSAALELFSEMKEEAPVRFFGGTADELLRELSAYRLDAVILPQGNETRSIAHVNTQTLTLKRTPVFLENVALEPIMLKQARFVALWQTGIPDADCFMKCLQRFCAAKE